LERFATPIHPRQEHELVLGQMYLRINENGEFNMYGSVAHMISATTAWPGTTVREYLELAFPSVAHNLTISTPIPNDFVSERIIINHGIFHNANNQVNYSSIIWNELFGFLTGEVGGVFAQAGTFTSLILSANNASEEIQRQRANIEERNAIISNNELGEIFRNLHIDAVVISDGTANQQLIPFFTQYTHGRLQHFDFDCISSVFNNPRESLAQIHRINMEVVQ